MNEETKPERKKINQFYYIGKLTLDAPIFTGGIDYRASSMRNKIKKKDDENDETK